jgi:hypothetical protein
MRTAEEIVQYIDNLEQRMLKRPGMYAGSPQSLEIQIELLESLRAFILTDQSEPLHLSAYREYAQRVAKVGPLSFTVKRSNDIWHQFIDFFRGYLANQGRIKEKTSSRQKRKRMK